MWQKISLLGSLVVMAPAATAIVAGLISAKAWRLTLIWGCLFASGMALVVLSKIAFIGWGIGIESIGLTCFSGHAMRAAAVLPVAGYLCFRQGQGMVRHVGWLAGVFAAVLISYSRIMVQAHSVSEAVTGCALGLMVAFGFIWYVHHAQKFMMNRVLVMLSVAMLTLTPSAKPAPTEKWMMQLALYLSGHTQPFTRSDWKQAKQSVAAPALISPEKVSMKWYDQHL